MEGTIVETEAYSQEEEACHGFMNKTESNKTLFGEPGLYYVYKTKEKLELENERTKLLMGLERSMSNDIDQLYDYVYEDNKVLTINDPCFHSDRIPSEITSFQCDNDMTQNGIHTDSGRLIIGILHEAEEYDYQDIDDNLFNMCETRNSTPIDELRGGMGDISLQLYSL